MKKLIAFSSLFALLFLFLAGCQKTADITSPDNLNKPPAIYNYTCDPTPVTDGTVDLVAGQFFPVGYATFHITTPDGNLEITYEDTTAGSLITEVHIDFATTLNNDAANGGFHANSTGNPQPGLFDLNEMLSPGQTTWSTTVLKADLLNYLNLPAGSDLPDDFYIAAHGVVSYAGGEGICPSLPNGHYRQNVSVPSSNYYLENAELTETSDPSSTLIAILNGWCIERGVSAFPDNVIQVDFLCSTEDISCFVDHPENIGAVNWILNNKTFGQGLYGDPQNNMADIQAAIWVLLDDAGYAGVSWESQINAARVNALVTEALTHNSFVPGCGEIIGVVMFETGVDYCIGENGMQGFLVEQTVECGGSDTMWGFDWDFDNGEPLDNFSCRFVESGNWARYFNFPTSL